MAHRRNGTKVSKYVENVWVKKKGVTADYYYHPQGKGYVAIAPLGKAKYHVIKETYGYGRNMDKVVKYKKEALKQAKKYMGGKPKLVG